MREYGRHNGEPSFGTNNVVDKGLLNREIITPNEAIDGETFDLLADAISRETNPTLLVDYIHDMSELLKVTHLSSEDAKDLLSKIESISLSGAEAPLASMSLTYLKGCIAADYLHDSAVSVKMSKYFFDDLLDQERLHEEYPALSQDDYVIRFAPDIASSVDTNYHIIKDVALAGATSTISGNTNPLVDPFVKLLEGNEVDNVAPLWLLTFAHDVRFRGLLEDKIGLNIADIPIDSQMQLLRFMAEAGDNRFERLCGTLHKVDDSLRLKLASGFLAAGFGEDFGDSLLDIANSERIDSEQLTEILDTVESCRNSIKKITDFYDGFDDGKFASEYARAANERLTDAITVFRAIAKDGEAKATPGWLGETRFGYTEAMQALSYEAKSLRIISGTLGDVAAGKEGAFAEIVLTPDESRDRSLYNFYSPDHGYVLLYTRAEGSSTFDPTLEYGKASGSNAGVEASISLITDPVDPFRLPKPFKPSRDLIRNPHYYDHATMDKVSAIRLDREGRTKGMAADDSDRSPLNPVGMVSVDLAAIGDREDTPSGKIARLLSVGGELRAEVNGSNSSLNHNTKWFDQEQYGTAEGFKKLVYYVDTMAKDWCREVPPREGEGFTWRMRAINRNRGKKALTKNVA